MSTVTAKEIAQELGISQAAVSLALNDKPGVSEETRRLVRETAIQKGMSLPTLQPFSGPGKRICFLIFVNHLVSIAENTTFSSFLLKGAADWAQLLGHTITVHYVNAHEAPLSVQLGKLLPDTDGVMLVGTDITEESRKEISAVFEKRPELPLVVLDSISTIAKADYICNDNFEGARKATEYLIEHGCRRIAYFRSSFRNQNFEDRQMGVLAALEASGLNLACTMDTDVSFEGAYKRTMEFLEKTEELPDGVFAENDVVAAAAIRACNACGVKVPEQLSIIGFDDIPICELCSPALTTVHSNKEQLGQIGVGILNMHMAGLPLTESGSMKVFLSTELHIRDSVK